MASITSLAQSTVINEKVVTTKTKTTYDSDSNGNILPNTVKTEVYTFPDKTASGTGTLSAVQQGNSNVWSYPTGTTLTAEQQNSLKGGELYKTVNQQITTSATKNGVKPDQLNTLTKKPPTTAINNPDDPTATGAPPPDDESKKQFNEENESFRKGTREKYADQLYYPLDLNISSQDCIKFTILQYTPSLSTKTNKTGDLTDFSGLGRIVELESGSPVVKGSTRLGTITLPIPGGISDSNTVSWGDERLNNLQETMGDIATKYIVGGAEAGGEALSEGKDKLTSGVGDASTKGSLAALIAGFAVQAGSSIQKRAYGTVFNDNLELLFTSPDLRSFTFTFDFYPRSESEAKTVKKIIRSFKQAMSVKRSSSALLLKSPHTFAISYVTPKDKSGQTQHPYLNKFKECALQSCSVDYTPGGNYMTYWSVNPEGRSMTGYKLTLQFKELTAVFDDEYGNEPIDSPTLDIGY